MDGKNPFSILMPFMQLAGMTKKKGRHILFVVCTTHQTINLVMHIAASTINIFLATDFWNETMESIQFSISATHLLTKQINFVTYRKDYEKLFERIKEVWEECWEEAEYRPVLIEGKRRADFLTKFLLICFFSGILTQNMFTTIANLATGHQNLPFQMWVPNEIGGYTTRVLIQDWLVLGPVLGDAMCCAFYRTVSVLICSLMIVTQKKLKSNSFEPHQRRKMFVLHQSVIKLVDELNHLHSGQIVFEVLMTSILTCIRGYSCVKAASNGDLRCLAYLYILFLCLISTYLICANGTMISHESDKMHFAAYQNKWYEQSVQFKKDLLIVSTAAEKTLTLHYRRLLTFDMVRFAMVLQGTYSYLTILKFFDV